MMPYKINPVVKDEISRNKRQSWLITYKYKELFYSSKFAHISSIQFCILSGRFSGWWYKTLADKSQQVHGSPVL